MITVEQVEEARRWLSEQRAVVHPGPIETVTAALDLAKVVLGLQPDEVIKPAGRPEAPARSDMDDATQRTEWKVRFLSDVLTRAHDDETLAAMTLAALNMSHSEGLKDAVFLCQSVVNASRTPEMQRAGEVLLTALKELASVSKLECAVAQAGGQ